MLQLTRQAQLEGGGVYLEEVGVVHGQHHIVLDQLLHILQANNAVPANTLAVLHNIVQHPVDQLWVKLLQLWKQLPIRRAVLCTNTHTYYMICTSTHNVLSNLTTAP